MNLTDGLENAIKRLAVNGFKLLQYPQLHPNMVQDSPEHKEYNQICSKFDMSLREFLRLMKSEIQLGLAKENAEEQLLEALKKQYGTSDDSSPN